MISTVHSVKRRPRREAMHSGEVVESILTAIGAMEEHARGFAVAWRSGDDRSARRHLRLFGQAWEQIPLWNEDGRKAFKRRDRERIGDAEDAALSRMFREPEPCVMPTCPLLAAEIEEYIHRMQARVSQGLMETVADVCAVLPESCCRRWYLGASQKDIEALRLYARERGGVLARLEAWEQPAEERNRCLTNLTNL